MALDDQFKGVLPYKAARVCSSVRLIVGSQVGFEQQFLIGKVEEAGTSESTSVEAVLPQSESWESVESSERTEWGYRKGIYITTGRIFVFLVASIAVRDIGGHSNAIHIVCPCSKALLPGDE